MLCEAFMVSCCFVLQMLHEGLLRSVMAKLALSGDRDRLLLNEARNVAFDVQRQQIHDFLLLLFVCSNDDVFLDEHVLETSKRRKT